MSVPADEEDPVPEQRVDSSAADKPVRDQTVKGHLAMSRKSELLAARGCYFIFQSEKEPQGNTQKWKDHHQRPQLRICSAL